MESQPETESTLSASATPKTSTGDADDIELSTLGYQRQMPRQFSVYSLIALSFALTCPWAGTGSSLGISSTEASSAGYNMEFTNCGYVNTEFERRSTARSRDQPVH